MIRAILMVLGVLLVLLGGLWFLQGAGIVHLEPIACIANCETVNGPSLGWALAGGIMMIVGGALVTIGVRRKAGKK